MEPFLKNLVGVSVSVQYRAKNFDPFFMHAIYLYVELGRYSKKKICDLWCFCNFCQTPYFWIVAHFGFELYVCVKTCNNCFNVNFKNVIMNTLQSVIDHSCISNLMYSFVFGEALQWNQSMKNQVSLLLDFQLKILRRTQHAIF